MKKFSSAIQAIVFVLVLGGIVLVATQLQTNLSPDDSSASGYNLLALRIQNSPAQSNGFALSENVVVGIFAELTGGQTVTAAEIKIGFNPTYLRAENITVDSSLLSPGNNINNTTGNLSFDVAKIGGGEIQNNDLIAQISFGVKNLGTQNTKVNVNESSTLGSLVGSQFVNTLGPNSFGQVTVPLFTTQTSSSSSSSSMYTFTIPSSSSSTSSVSSTSSATTNPPVNPPPTNPPVNPPPTNPPVNPPPSNNNNPPAQNPPANNPPPVNPPTNNPPVVPPTANSSSSSFSFSTSTFSSSFSSSSFSFTTSSQTNSNFSNSNTSANSSSPIGPGTGTNSSNNPTTKFDNNGEVVGFTDQLQITLAGFGIDTRVLVIILFLLAGLSGIATIYFIIRPNRNSNEAF